MLDLGMALVSRLLKYIVGFFLGGINRGSGADLYEVLSKEVTQCGVWRVGLFGGIIWTRTLPSVL